jgi:hypothetical protein
LNAARRRERPAVENLNAAQQSVVDGGDIVGAQRRTDHRLRGGRVGLQRTDRFGHAFDQRLDQFLIAIEIAADKI